MKAEVIHIRSFTNHYGERVHEFTVNGKSKTYNIPMGAKQSVEGLIRLLERSSENPAPPSNL